MGRWQACVTSRDGCPGCGGGGGGMERDPIVGLMLAGQDDNAAAGQLILTVNLSQGFGTGPGSRTG